MNTIFQTATASYTYPQFITHLEALLAQGKTTGANQTEEYLHYAKLNLQRMRRWDKTFQLHTDMLALLPQLPQQHWWVITEGWCGDSAQNLPAIVKMAAAAGPQIDLRIVLRDENPEIIDQFLTNGTRSIPVIVGVDAAGKQLFRWGPRPQAAQDLLTAWKAEVPQRSFEAFEQDMHTWYTKDKGQTLQAEWLTLLAPFAPKGLPG